MSRLNLFTSFLDRFEVLLEVDSEKLKRDLVAKVDRQFEALKAKVRELKNEIGGRSGGALARSSHVDLLDVDPKVENVSLEEWRCAQQAVATTADQQANMPSTSSGRKRSTHSQTGSTPSKIRKINRPKKFVCKFVGCQQSFRAEDGLKNHERIHLGIKPFICTWPHCSKSEIQRNNLVTHIRVVHFKLPRSVKQQKEANIEDDRDPNDFIRVHSELANRRL